MHDRLRAGIIEFVSTDGVISDSLIAELGAQILSPAPPPTPAPAEPPIARRQVFVLHPIKWTERGLVRTAGRHLNVTGTECTSIK
jgi:hypothetical protein